MWPFSIRCGVYVVLYCVSWILSNTKTTLLGKRELGAVVCGSMYVIGLIVVIFVLLMFQFQFAIEPFVSFHHSILITCVFCDVIPIR